MSSKPPLELVVQDATTKTFSGDFTQVLQIAQEFRDAFGHKDEKGVFRYRGQLIKTAKQLEATSVAYKVLVGAAMEPIKDLESRENFEQACEEIGLTAETVSRYIRIWVAWFSGTYLYNLSLNPETKMLYNPLELGIKNLDYGASLILAGEFDERACDLLFGKGDWLTKRELIRGDKDEQGKNGGPVSKMRRRNKKTKKAQIGKDGDIWYKVPTKSSPVRLGWIDIQSHDEVVQALALRCREAIKRELD